MTPCASSSAPRPALAPRLILSRLPGDPDDRRRPPGDVTVDSSPQPHQAIVKAHLIPVQTGALEDSAAHEPRRPGDAVEAEYPFYHKPRGLHFALELGFRIAAEMAQRH